MRLVYCPSSAVSLQHFQYAACTLSVKRVFEYLKATKVWVLKFDVSKKADEILKSFSDAEFVLNKLNRKFSSVWLAKCYGFIFLWNSHRQNYVPLSTTEAE